MNTLSTYHGGCFCGDVKFSLSGQAEAMAYCHCDSCRHWAAAPISAFTLWNKDSLKITKGANNIGAFDKHAHQQGSDITSNRQWCKTCGGHVFTDHPGMGLIDVPAGVIKDFEFKPAFHVHYQETVHPMKDGLPKFKDLPEPAGGSGKQLDE